MDNIKGQFSRFFTKSSAFYIIVTALILGSFIGCTLIAYTAFKYSVPKLETLQQVVFLFRHGERNPVMTYPKDPYMNYNWPNGLGALTKNGMWQLYDMGQWVRKKYGAIIDEQYKKTNILVRSTNSERCIMSAQALLAGLFVPNDADMFVFGLKWTPVPVFVIPEEMDKLLSVKAPCPRLERALEKAFLEEHERIGAKLTDYYKNLTEYTGQNMSTILDVSYLYDILYSQEQHGLKLPTWTHKYYNNQMREISIRSYELYTDDDIQKRLRGGLLLKEVLQHMKERKTNRNSRRAYFYFSHDTTIINVMRTIGFTNKIKPDYGASVIFELHLTESGDQEVKMLYFNSMENRVISPLEIPNCARPCLLQNLKQTWREVIPDNWDAECNM